MMRNLLSLAACASIVAVCWTIATPNHATPGYAYECSNGTAIYIDGADVEVSDAMTDAACDTQELVEEVNAYEMTCYDRFGNETSGEDWKECRASYS